MASGLGVKLPLLLQESSFWAQKLLRPAAGCISCCLNFMQTDLPLGIPSGLPAGWHSSESLASAGILVQLSPGCFLQPQTDFLERPSSSWEPGVSTGLTLPKLKHSTAEMDGIGKGWAIGTL